MPPCLGSPAAAASKTAIAAATWPPVAISAPVRPLAPHTARRWHHSGLMLGGIGLQLPCLPGHCRRPSSRTRRRQFIKRHLAAGCPVSLVGRVRSSIVWLVDPWSHRSTRRTLCLSPIVLLICHSLGWISLRRSSVFSRFSWRPSLQWVISCRVFSLLSYCVGLLSYIL